MILIVSNMYPSEKFPNYGVFVQNFCKEIGKSMPIKLITLNKEPNIFLKVIKYMAFYLKVFFHYAFVNYDLVYVHYAGHNSPPLLLGKMVNKSRKLVVNVHGSDVTPEKKLEELTNGLTKSLVQKADLTIVPSTYFDEIVKAKYGSNLRTFVSPSAGINSTLFSPKVYNQKSAKKLVLGYVSRIDYEKGWDLLLHSVSELSEDIPEIQLILVGGGSQNQAAIQLIKDLKLETIVRKIEMLSQPELVEVYNELDVFIFPSSRAGESLGLVGLEAMACGVPVIGSNFGGIKTYVNHGENGYLFEKNNKESLKKAISAFYRLNSVERNYLSGHALETSRTYDSKLVNQRLINQLKKMIEDR